MNSLLVDYGVQGTVFTIITGVVVRYNNTGLQLAFRNLNKA